MFDNVQTTSKKIQTPETEPEQKTPAHTSSEVEARAVWLERIDPGAHRRIKGLRLVTAYGIAAMLGTLLGVTYGFPGGPLLGYLAGGFALWASVSEGRSTRYLSSRDLVILTMAGALGAISMICLAPLLSGKDRPGPELTFVIGAFLVGYLKRFGILGAGIGSQIYIGQFLAYQYGLTFADLSTILLAELVALVAAVVPRLLSGPAEHPASILSISVVNGGGLPQELRMGLQAGAAALAIVLLGNIVNLKESAWAITACTYVIAGSAIGTMSRVLQRVVGTLIGVPLGIACLPITEHAVPLAWMLAAAAMIIYSMALPDRYDIACGAYAFALMVTLALGGQHSEALLAARIWETILGATLGFAAATFILPLRTSRPISS